MAKNRKTPDMNLPMWFDGQNINEALFCEEFLQERRIIFANGAFFTPDGRVTDDLPLRGEIYDKLKFCAVNNIPRKIANILEVLKLSEGNDTVVIYLEKERAKKILPPAWKICANETMMERLKNMVGENNIKLVEKGLKR